MSVVRTSKYYRLLFDPALSSKTGQYVLQARPYSYLAIIKGKANAIAKYERLVEKAKGSKLPAVKW